ncbi:putative aldouronate transport system permease protein [Paenibacillus sp. UNCCL117]|uniref:carbohydrate ABC transporter permease n=1 Tax=unclassified Paenibacillus TaxID=185978 RepID=UPI00089022B1|nr:MULTISPECIES: carbohydrate ABC transporter permease [unclassified Paenibacillus]SDD03339.1 carbohydrate ABC transporter membrane protein 2, CUT1 family [Paenibacillus sp. cl123]SFW32331.1 putative aldouronate transport system permease protein [Paenibacillus sp. UNCCL117]
MHAMNESKLRSRDDKLFDAVVYVITAVLLVMVGYPLLFVISASFSNPIDVVEGRVWLLPEGFTLEPYKRVFENEKIWNGYANTIFYAIAGTFINLVMTVLAAYPLSRKDLPGQQFLMFFVIFTMFFSGGLIPTYLLVKSLGINNTVWAMLLPGAIATYNLIVMRSFFQNSIPNELQESAWMDGCTFFRMLWSIILPLSKPILAVMVLFYGVGHWNAYFNALIYLKDRELYPLQLILREILILNQDDMAGGDAGMTERVMMAESIKYSVILISSVPVLLLYPFIQRYFVKGVMIGSIKG